MKVRLPGTRKFEAPALMFHGNNDINVRAEMLERSASFLAKALGN